MSDVQAYLGNFQYTEADELGPQQAKGRSGSIFTIDESEKNLKIDTPDGKTHHFDVTGRPINDIEELAAHTEKSILMNGSANDGKFTIGSDKIDTAIKQATINDDLGQIGGLKQGDARLERLQDNIKQDLGAKDVKIRPAANGFPNRISITNTTGEVIEAQGPTPHKMVKKIASNPSVKTMDTSGTLKSTDLIKTSKYEPQAHRDLPGHTEQAVRISEAEMKKAPSIGSVTTNANGNVVLQENNNIDRVQETIDKQVAANAAKPVIEEPKIESVIETKVATPEKPASPAINIEHKDAINGLSGDDTKRADAALSNKYKQTEGFASADGKTMHFIAPDGYGGGVHVTVKGGKTDVSKFSDMDDAKTSFDRQHKFAAVVDGKTPDITKGSFDQLKQGFNEIVDTITDSPVTKKITNKLGVIGGAAAGLMAVSSGANASEVAAAAIPGGEAVLDISEGKTLEGTFKAIEETGIGSIFTEMARPIAHALGAQNVETGLLQDGLAFVADSIEDGALSVMTHKEIENYQNVLLEDPDIGLPTEMNGIPLSEAMRDDKTREAYISHLSEKDNDDAISVINRFEELEGTRQEKVMEEIASLGLDQPKPQETQPEPQVDQPENNSGGFARLSDRLCK